MMKNRIKPLANGKGDEEEYNYELDVSDVPRLQAMKDIENLIKKYGAAAVKGAVMAAPGLGLVQSAAVPVMGALGGMNAEMLKDRPLNDVMKKRLLEE